MISRRQFLSYSFLGGLGLACNKSAWASEASFDLRKEEVLVPLKDLAPAFDGFRIGFLSDLHLGAFVPHEWIESALRTLIHSSVDVILLGGDYISVKDSFNSLEQNVIRNTHFADSSKDALAEHIMVSVADLLAHVKPAEGTYAVFGNHDKYVPHGFRRSVLKQKGIGVLENSSVEIKRDRNVLRIVGVDDLISGKPSLAKFPETKPRNETRIVLSHNPDFLSHTLRRTRFNFDLGLAGHTHGGQIKLPFVGALDYNIADNTFREGLQCYGDSCVYTTRGIGVVRFPWRFNCPPEVTVLTLQSQ